MNRTPLLMLVATMVGMLLLFFWPESEPQQAVHLQGVKLSEYSLMNLDGQPVSYSPEKGKVIVLNLWATWCPPCREEMPSLQRLADKLDDATFQVVGIAMDSDDHLVREFLNDRQVHFLNMLDATDNVISGEFMVQALPSTLIVDQQGEVVEVITGGREWDSPELFEIIEKVGFVQ